MREPSHRHDRHEIAVSAETRIGRPPAAPRRSAGPPVATRESGAWLAALGGAARGFGRLCRHRPGEVIGSVLALGAVGIVSMNALGFQGGRHPAPIRIGAGAPPAKAPARPAVGGPTADASASPEAPPVREAARPAPAAEPRPDPIARIIKAAESTASVAPKPEPKIAEAQRALVKLGYGPLKADGVMGPGTRAAIERFERDRKLPVKGEAGGRTLRELAARAGAAKG
ncbi:peptidoglycan-binding domain-containing protein [Methylobacterium iners]|uniref:Peptidoglycan binding-like domain-containing protein n=1 Tax=Methylobacterium iners TaxID=418707 RepID=A0ABQ4S1Z6_9HYPH|nr:peptidoglycan-binding domain-containing protein [Methylobacterium iners]GJD97146.1 hypothetical protein OCOJLMKI_4374 [Methylobacterium iners]